jgi:transketolase
MANAIRALTMDAVEQAKSGHPGMPMGTAPRIAVEAAVQFGWERWLGPQGAFIGMTGFGASAPGEALFPHFGITPEKVAEAARSLL